jgi:MSHA biogenesis protein MshO
MQLNRKFQPGFTLIEMIVVMVITGILGGIVALMINGPVQGYVDSARRAEMADIGDTALSRITRDLRIALPNSVRITPVGSTYYLEFIPTTGGGRYRASSGVAGDDILDFTQPDISFDVLGPIPTFVSGEYIVVDNTSTVGVYGFSNVAACPAASPYCASTNSSTGAPAITLAAAMQFPSPSPGNRFQVISTPVTYVCSPATGGVGGTLARYWGYAIQAAQPVSIAAAPLSTATQALLATNVSACNFSLPQGNSLVAMQLTITESGESISLYQEINVNNAP